MVENIKEEQIFYKDTNVTVTQTRYISGNKTYAMRNISSVSIFRVEQSRLGPKLIFIIGLLVFLISDDIKMLGLILVALGIIWYISIKDLFSVRISTNAGEANTLVSKDEPYIKKVVNALNNAIIHRG